MLQVFYRHNWISEKCSGTTFLGKNHRNTLGFMQFYLARFFYRHNWFREKCSRFFIDIIGFVKSAPGFSFKTELVKRPGFFRLNTVYNERQNEVRQYRMDVKMR